MSYKSGFSLIELMVVIAIIALLAAVAVPSYKSYIARVQVANVAAAVDDMNNALITAYNTGLWSCSINTFTYKGVTQTVNDSATSATSQFPGLLDDIELQHDYGTYSCADGATIATFQYTLTATNLPASSGTQLVCIIQDKGSSGTIKKCGVWDGTYTWQLGTAYLPPGYDCLLSTNVTVRGTPCH